MGLGGTRPEQGSLAVPRGYVAAWIVWAGLGVPCAEAGGTEH